MIDALIDILFIVGVQLLAIWIWLSPNYIKARLILVCLAVVGIPVVMFVRGLCWIKDGNWITPVGTFIGKAIAMPLKVGCWIWCLPKRIGL